MHYRRGPKRAAQMKFGGLNRMEGAGDGELTDMKNLSGDRFPALSPRSSRYLLHRLTKPNGLAASGGSFWVDGTGLFREGVRLGTVTDTEKTFAFLGDYVMVFPDKVYWHKTTKQFGTLEAVWTGTAKFTDGLYAGVSAKRNSIVSQGAAFPFEADEAVEISGCTQSANNQTLIIREVSEDRKTLRFYENSFSETSVTCPVTIRRKVPDMDYLCENENRLWGCKGSTVYASALGNPKVWENYDLISTASFSAQVGSPGDFTGCCSFLGYPVFFKEEQIYKVYGSKPSNFRLMGSAALGVEAGSAKSLSIAGNKLYYLSRSGVMVYSGGVPQPVSRKLGSGRLKNGTAGSNGRTYYLSAQNEQGDFSFLALDTDSGMWYREDDTRVKNFAFDGELTFLTASGGLYLGGEPRSIPSGAVPDSVDSMAEFADFIEGSPDKKWLSRLSLRLELEQGASLAVEAQYDSDGVWRKVGDIPAGNKRSVQLPLIPRRCDHYRLRLQGKGQWKLLSLLREYRAGSLS